MAHHWSIAPIMGSFTAVDIIVAVVMLAMAGFSFFRGFVHQVLAIGAWIGALAVTFYGFDMVRPLFRQHISSTMGADVAAGAALFLGSLLIFSVITKVVSDRVRRSALNSVDSSLGFVLGLVMGAGLMSLAYMGLTLITGQESLPDWLAEARTRPWLERGANLIRQTAPSGFGAAEQKTQDVRNDAKSLMETEKTLQKYMAPQPSQGPEDKGTQGQPAKRSYDKEGRGQMDRLFQTNQ